MEQYNEKIGTRKDLVSYRIETAKSDLKSAKILLYAFFAKLSRWCFAI